MHRRYYLLLIATLSFHATKSMQPETDATLQAQVNELLPQIIRFEQEWPTAHVDKRKERKELWARLFKLWEQISAYERTKDTPKDTHDQLRQVYQAYFESLLE